MKNICFFGNAFLCKCLYRGIYGDGQWCRLVKTKYLKGKSVHFWYRKRTLGTRSGSMIWQRLRKVHPFFMKKFCWTLYSGSNIFIAFDSILSGRWFTFPHPLSYNFHRLGVFKWDKLIKGWSGASPIWKDGEELHLLVRCFLYG